MGAEVLESDQFLSDEEMRKTPVRWTCGVCVSRRNSRPEAPHASAEARPAGAAGLGGYAGPGPGGGPRRGRGGASLPRGAAAERASAAGVGAVRAMVKAMVAAMAA